MHFFKPIDLLYLTIVSHSKPITLRRGINRYIYILFFSLKSELFLRAFLSLEIVYQTITKQIHHV